MGKVLGIFSTKIKGKVGNVVYRNTSDGNVVSEKAAEVSNPRTLAQQYQRMIFNTCLRARQAFGTIVNHSFYNATGKTHNLSTFMSENLKALRESSSTTEEYYTPKNSLGISMFPFFTSKGSLESNFNYQNVYALDIDEDGEITAYINSNIKYDGATSYDMQDILVPGRTYTFAFVVNQSLNPVYQATTSLPDDVSIIGTKLYLIQFQVKSSLNHTIDTGVPYADITEDDVDFYSLPNDNFSVKLNGTQTGNWCLQVNAGPQTASAGVVVGFSAWESQYDDEWNYTTSRMSASFGTNSSVTPPVTSLLVSNLFAPAIKTYQIEQDYTLDTTEVIVGNSRVRYSKDTGVIHYISQD